MDFAKEQLSKHGWTEGQGLGKTESGITEAIKVKIKQNKTGVGHDPGEEFSFHWWDHVFNKAASKIKVKTTQNGVEIENEGDTEVTKKKDTKAYCNKDMLYGQFVKGATLSDGTETKEAENENKSEDEEQTPTVQCLMPDQAETVFKMCGGRTAHKGARHGLKLNGKLQRIEEQERLLLESYMASKKSPVVDSVDNNLHDATNKEDIEESSVKRKRKKDKKLKRKLENIIERNQMGSSDVEDALEITGDSKIEDVVNNEHINEVKVKKRKKSKRSREKTYDEIDGIDDCEVASGEVNDKAVKELSCDDTNVNNCDIKEKKNKKKKRSIKE